MEAPSVRREIETDGLDQVRGVDGDLDKNVQGFDARLINRN